MFTLLYRVFTATMALSLSLALALSLQSVWCLLSNAFHDYPTTIYSTMGTATITYTADGRKRIVTSFLFAIDLKGSRRKREAIKIFRWWSKGHWSLLKNLHNSIHCIIVIIWYHFQQQRRADDADSDSYRKNWICTRKGFVFKIFFHARYKMCWFLKFLPLLFMKFLWPPSITEFDVFLDVCILSGMELKGNLYVVLYSPSLPTQKSRKCSSHHRRHRQQTFTLIQRMKQSCTCTEPLPLTPTGTKNII